MIFELIKKYKKQILGIIIGGVLGFFYYYFIGCASGSCMISSNPFVAVPYGSLLGFLFAGTFNTKKNAST